MTAHDIVVIIACIASVFALFVAWMFYCSAIDYHVSGKILRDQAIKLFSKSRQLLENSKVEDLDDLSFLSDVARDYHGDDDDESFLCDEEDGNPPR